MKYYLFVVLWLLTLNSFSQERIQVNANKNMELLGLMYTIVFENPDHPLYDTHNPDWEYGSWILENYGQFGQNKQLLALLPKIDHLWINDFFALLLKVEDFPHASLSDEISNDEILHFSSEKDPDEARKIASQFLKTMNRFYKEVKFDNYWKVRSSYYQSAIDEINEALNDQRWLEQAESFYQHAFEGYQVFPSLTLPPSMGFATNDASQAFALITAQESQLLEKRKMGFGANRSVLDLYIHELGHALLGPTFLKIPETLFEKTSPAFTAVSSAMHQQNYLSWKGIVNEYFTRSGEIIIKRIMKDTLAESRLTAYHLNQKEFIYLPLFVDELWTNYQKGNSYLTGMKASLNRLAMQHIAYSATDSSDGEALKIKGTVMDLEYKSSLPFVNIGIVDRNVGTISKEDGTFELVLQAYSEMDSIRFSMVGYHPYSISIHDVSDETLQIFMSKNIKLLNEVRVSGTEINELVVEGRKKKTRRTRGQSNSNSYGTGAAYGIRMNMSESPIMLKDVNFHMRFNTTDSILFRINIYNIENGLPQQSILKNELFMKSYKGQKWIKKDFSHEQLIIDQDVIITYEVVKVWFSNKTYNNIFLTFGEGYEEGGQYMRQSSFAKWETAGDAFPITLYITGRAL